MCNSVTILVLFIIFKIIAILILPIIIIVNLKKEQIKKLIIVDIIMILFILICNIFSINSCVYNSNIEGIKRTINNNNISEYNLLHPLKSTSYDEVGITSNKKYRTINNTELYYYNQNEPYMNNAYYECEKNKMYIDSFGSAITSFSIAISTIYKNDINPIKIFNTYKKDNDLCTKSIEIPDIYDSVMKIYGGIQLTEISKEDVYSSLKNDGYVIVELNATENSKLTCDNGYIVIYNIAKDGNYMIADPSLKRSDFICPYSSVAYGNVISKDNMEKSWSLEEIDNEAVRYYLIKKGL